LVSLTITLALALALTLALTLTLTLALALALALTLALTRASRKSTNVRCVSLSRRLTSSVVKGCDHTKQSAASLGLGSG